MISLALGVPYLANQSHRGGKRNGGRPIRHATVNRARTAYARTLAHQHSIITVILEARQEKKKKIGKSLHRPTIPVSELDSLVLSVPCLFKSIYQVVHMSGIGRDRRQQQQQH